MNANNKMDNRSSNKIEDLCYNSEYNINSLNNQINNLKLEDR